MFLKLIFLPDREEHQIKVEDPSQISFADLLDAFGIVWAKPEEAEFYSFNEQNFIDPYLPLDQSCVADGDTVVLVPIYADEQENCSEDNVTRKERMENHENSCRLS